ncbi:protein of unknown function [Bradyrhizobium vignae]|uniref:Uncharacterized protein n=1 Tax=Bradyrhizobium vignae TaxID=1549949 RepID=A0A2U3PSK3_9BRAD|nr:protein of unknown function [Bradyrhizobium vignae]
MRKFRRSFGKAAEAALAFVRRQCGTTRFDLVRCDLFDPGGVRCDRMCRREDRGRDPQAWLDQLADRIRAGQVVRFGESLLPKSDTSIIPCEPTNDSRSPPPAV